MKNAIPFFSISLAFMKPEISATFFSDKVEFFGDFSQILLKSIFSSYCSISLLTKMSK